MKTISIILSLSFALAGNSGILQAAPLEEPRDTVNHYIIDNRPVEQFDGSQLQGKEIVSYRISTIGSTSEDAILIHDIRTKGKAQTADPIYVIDGEQVSKQEFENLNPQGIKSITVVKGGRQKEVRQYPGWENGVIMVVTKGNDPVSSDRNTQVEIGYGKADSRDIAYSVSSVKPGDNEYYTNMYEYLRSKVAGVEVRADNSIIIRGVTTMNSSTAPLILVDGMEINDLSIIDPHDVYSVDVLKDGSSSIYGFKGANGVIQITTKKGQQLRKQEAAERRQAREARRSKKNK